jgi:hypothetical protein
VEKLVKDFLGAYFEMGFFLFCFFFRSLIFNQRLDLIAFMLFFFSHVYFGNKNVLLFFFMKLEIK